MGVYVNPGSKLFEMSLNSMIYVDKSGIIEYINSIINTENRFICVSRPRRFGKTMGLNMLSAYYGCNNDVKMLFKDLKADSEHKYAGKFNILMLNAVTFFKTNDKIEEALEKWIRKLSIDFEEEFENIDFSKCETLDDYCNRVYSKTKKQFVILIDEWDGIFRAVQSDNAGQRAYLDFLRDWLKDQPYVALAYMTGILPIKKYGAHSALNMFEEFSMEDPKELAEFVGFTSDEVESLCTKYNMDLDLCRQWYDGYGFKNETEIYAPLSVVRAMKNRDFDSYWNSTESYEALRVYIKRDFDGLREKVIRLMSGEEMLLNTASFSNDMTTFNCADDILTLLVHLGYLTYFKPTRKVRIPNNEVRREFRTAVSVTKDFGPIARAMKNSDELLEATWNMNAEAVAKGIKEAHVETAHIQYNDENALSYTVSLAYYTAREVYNVYRELPTGKGFADLVFIPRINHPEVPPMIVELKWDKSARTALDQIKDKEYTEKLSEYAGKILLVGINYNKQTKEHECIIEIG